MKEGEVSEVTTGSCTDLYYVETGMYDTTGYGTVYLLDAERPAIIESGIGRGTDQILEAADRVGIHPDEIEILAVTHVHLDHAGGVGKLANDCPNATVVVHESGARHLVDPTRLVEGTKAVVGDQWCHYGDPKPVDEDRIRTVADGDHIDIGDHALDVHAAPGHAPHQVVFEDPANDAVFTGDAAGIWVPDLDRIVETSPPPQFDLEQCLRDIDMLSELDPSTLLFTHFGPAERENLLERYKRVLSEWVEAVERQRAKLGDDDLVRSHFRNRTDLESVWGEEKAAAEMDMNVRGVLTYLDTL